MQTIAETTDRPTIATADAAARQWADAVAIAEHTAARRIAAERNAANAETNAAYFAERAAAATERADAAAALGTIASQYAERAARLTAAAATADADAYAADAARYHTAAMELADQYAAMRAAIDAGRIG